MNDSVELPHITSIQDFQQIRILLVNGTALEQTWDQFVRQYHYLGYTKMYGPRIKYLAMHQDQPLAAISYNRATLKVGVRDRFIGWDETLKQHIWIGWCAIIVFLSCRGFMYRILLRMCCPGRCGVLGKIGSVRL